MFKELKNFFKAIPNTYYNWRKRNEKIDLILSNYQTTLDTVSELKENFDSFKTQFSDLKNNVDTMISRLDTIKQGTRIELFDTLHNWRELLVVKRGWATPEEKKEVQLIYDLYSGDELKGNGNGDRYYKEIMSLPESKEEMEAQKNHV